MIFPKKKIEQQISKLASINTVFFMCTDTSSDNDINSYCLIRRIEDKKLGTYVSEIILCKEIKKRVQFEEEVKNLNKYFNAKLIER